MKHLKTIETAAMIHADSVTDIWGYSKISVGPTPTRDFRTDASCLEKAWGETSIRSSGQFDSSSAAMQTIARVPRHLWVELALYTIATIAIQILCIAIT